MSLSQKGNLAGTLSTHSLQVESIVPAAQNEEKVNVTSLCFLCFYVKMGIFWSKQEVMNDYPVHLFIRPLAILSTRYLVTLSARQFAKLCQLFSSNFNTKSALFIHQQSTWSQKIDSREGLF